MNRCPICAELAPCTRCGPAPIVLVSWRQTLAGIGIVLVFAGLMVFAV